MLTITLEASGKEPLHFEWRGTSDEFENLWDQVESSAADYGHDPCERGLIAAEMLIAGECLDDDARRGAAMATVYLVMRQVANDIDRFDPGTTEGATIFELAEQMRIEVTIRLDQRGRLH